MQLAVTMRGVAPGEPALHARVTLVGLAVLQGHHPYHLVTTKFGLERAADSAVGAGGEHRVLGHPRGDDRLLLQRRRGAGLPRGLGTPRPGRHERLARRRHHLRVKSPAGDGERERALYLGTRAHATRAGNARRRVEGEVGITLVLARRQMILAAKAVAHRSEE